METFSYYSIDTLVPLMSHVEIRLRILFYLYSKYYSGLRGHLNSKEVIEEAQLKDVDDYDVYGDIVYLADSNLVDYGKMWPTGYSYPPWIKITYKGIIYTENNFDKLVQRLNGSKIDERIRKEVTEILSKDNEKRHNIMKIWNYIKVHPVFLMNMLELMTKYGIR